MTPLTTEALRALRVLVEVDGPVGVAAIHSRLPMPWRPILSALRDLETQGLARFDFTLLKGWVATDAGRRLIFEADEVRQHHERRLRPPEYTPEQAAFFEEASARSGPLPAQPLPLAEADADPASALVPEAGDTHA